MSLITPAEGELIDGNQRASRDPPATTAASDLLTELCPIRHRCIPEQAGSCAQSAGFGRRGNNPAGAEPEEAAILVTTNLEVADWTQVFGDEKLTEALLDRLTHHDHILELMGESYRFRQRMEQDVDEPNEDVDQRVGAF